MHTRVFTRTGMPAPGMYELCLHSSSQSQAEGNPPSCRYSSWRTWDQSWLGSLTSLRGLGPVTHLGWASVSSSVKCAGGDHWDRAGWTLLFCLLVRCSLLPGPPSVVMGQSVQARRPPPCTGPATLYHLLPSLGSRVLAMPGPSHPPALGLCMCAPLRTSLFFESSGAQPNPP